MSGKDSECELLSHPSKCMSGDRGVEDGGDGGGDSGGWSMAAHTWDGSPEKL